MPAQQGSQEKNSPAVKGLTILISFIKYVYCNKSMDQ